MDTYINIGIDVGIWTNSYSTDPLNNILSVNLSYADFNYSKCFKIK